MKIKSINGVSLFVLFHYRDGLESMLYRYKALGENAMSRAFLWGYKAWFYLKYWRAIWVLAPFHSKQDFERGFSPLIRIFSRRRDVIQPFEKIDDYKQSDHPLRERIQIGDHVHFHREKLNHYSRKKRIVLIDDVVTSGETMKMMIHHMKTMGFDKIEAFALSRPTKA